MAGWINKRWPVQAMEYPLALKRKEIQTHATTWTNLDHIMLGEYTSHNGQLWYNSTYMRDLE